MAQETWTREELFEDVDPAPDFVAELERLGLLRVVARDAGNRPLYGPEARDQLERVLALVDLGYRPKDIAAIAHRVGLPEQGRGRFRRPPTYVRIDTLAERGGVSAECLSRWVDRGLIEPDMVTEGGEQLFAREQARSVARLRDLTTLGVDEETLPAWSRLMAWLDGLEPGREEESAGSEVDAATLEEAQERLAWLDERLRALRGALRRWDKLGGLYRKRLARLQRELSGGRRRRRRRRRVLVRSRGRKGPSAEPSGDAETPEDEE